MTGDIHQPSVEGRRNGFLRAMAEAGIPVRPEYMVTSWYIRGQSKADARKLLTLPDRPTAIVTGSDNIALDILEVARELKIAVPEELSVTGFDDYPLATLVTPQLTTVRQPLDELGKIATTMVLDQIEGIGIARGEILQSKLIIRDSTAPPSL